MSYDATVLAEAGLVAFWPLKETSGTVAADATGNGHNGTYAGGFTLGQTGIGDGETGVLWNGSTGQASATLALAPAKPYSLESWAFLTNTSQHGAVAKLGMAGLSGNGIIFGIGGTTLDNAGDNLIAAYENVSWNPTTTPLTASVWHHIVLAIDSGGAGVLYLDGASVLTIPNTTPPTNPGATSANLFSGGYIGPGSVPRWFAGKTAKFAVYNVALTATQVANHYNAASGGTTHPLTLTATSTGTVLLARQAGKGLTATGTGAASLVRRTGKSLTGSSTGLAAVVRQTLKPLTVTSTATASLVKQTAKTFAATSTGTATLATLKVILLTLAAVSTGTATLTRSVGKSLVAASTGTATLTRQVAKGLLAVAIGSASVAKRMGKTFAASSLGTAILQTLKTLFSAPTAIYPVAADRALTAMAIADVATVAIYGVDRSLTPIVGTDVLI